MLGPGRLFSAQLVPQLGEQLLHSEFCLDGLFTVLPYTLFWLTVPYMQIQIPGNYALNQGWKVDLIWPANSSLSVWLYELAVGAEKSSDSVPGFSGKERDMDKKAENW